MKTIPPVSRRTSKIKRVHAMMLRLSDSEETALQDLADLNGLSRQEVVRMILTQLHRRLILEPRLERGAGARRREEEQELLLRLRQIRNERIDAMNTALIPSLNGQPRLAQGARLEPTEARQILAEHEACKAAEQADHEARSKGKTRRGRR